jgi:PHAX RNA-binding domain
MTALLEAVWSIEAQGGIVLPDGRRRTPGGVLFYLTKVGATLQPPPWGMNQSTASQEQSGL